MTRRQEYIVSGGKIMCNMFSGLLSALVLVATLSSASFAYGEAFRVIGQGSSGSAQGDALAAQADDPSAVFYNPAGMAQVKGIQFSASTQLVGGHYDYKSPAGNKFSGDVNGEVAIPPPTNLYLTSNLDQLSEAVGGTSLLDHAAVGIGMNSPFGLVIRWPKNVPFSSVTTFAQLPLVDIKPALAYKFNEYFSVGAGLDIYTFIGFLGHGELRAKSFIPPDTNIQLDGKDTALGYNLGFLLTPWRTRINSAEKPRLNFAFVYRSRATLDLSGDFRINGHKAAGADFDLKLPQIFTWGVAVWPIRDESHEWRLETDFDYVDWSTFKSFDVRLSDGTTVTEPRNWKRVVTIKFGTEYKWLEIPGYPEWEVALRAGYVRANSPIPERTFEPRIPITDWDGFSLGVGFLCKGNASLLSLFRCGNNFIKAIGFDLTYRNQLYHSRTINNNVNPSVNGTYDTALHAGGLGVRIKF